MRKKWYIKSIATFLTVALTVSNIEPAIVMADNEAVVQDGNATGEDQAAVLSEGQTEDETLQGDESAVSEATENTASGQENSGSGEQTENEALPEENSVPEQPEDTAPQAEESEAQALTEESPVMIGETGYASLEEAVAQDRKSVV